MTSTRSFVIAAGFAAVTAISNGSGVKAAGDVDNLTAQPWSFEGIFGTFDSAEVQRGLQVYLEVCASCHGLDYIAFRNLAAIGYDEDQIEAIAGQYEVEDGPNSDGEMFTRTAQPSDYFVNPFANEKEAAAMGAIFIWLNSCAGLAARAGNFPDPVTILPLVLAVIIGGAAGSFLGANKYEPRTMQKLLGVIILIAIAILLGKIVL